MFASKGRLHGPDRLTLQSLADQAAGFDELVAHLAEPIGGTDESPEASPPQGAPA